MRSGMPPSVSPATQMNSATCSESVMARKKMKPKPIRQYSDLAKPRGRLDISGLIPAAPDRQDDLRVRGVLLDAAAQSLDERIDAALGDEGVIGPDPRQQRFAAEDDAGMRGEHEQQAEFLRGEIDILAVDAHAPPRRIDVQSVNLERPFTGSGSVGCRLQLRSSRPSQERARTRHELTNAERLGQIVIRAALE